MGVTESATVLGLITVRGGFTERAYRQRVLVVRGSLTEPQTFVITASTTWTRQNIGPIITSPIVPGIR